MLITNFAAGELAETLFGRVDLAQYYSGVSHLENFDVIPTGGISRRHGMKRIAVKDAEGKPVQLGEGRIIPFILNRDESFLLFLTPKKVIADLITPAMIRIFDRNGVQQEEPATSTSQVPLYETMDEINEVQYAQNYDKMIMVHKNYAPLEIKFFKDYFSITKFNIYDVIPRISDGDINTDSYIEADPAYKNPDGFILRSLNNYPGSVSFMNGRIVFAGTKNDPQRVFASRVGKIEEFATYKKYLTEHREYIVIYGKLNEDNPNVIYVDSENSAKITKAPENYFIQSDYFKTGTTVEVLSDGKIIASNGAILIPNLDDDEEKRFQDLKDKYEEYNINPAEHVLGSYTFNNINAGGLRWVTLPVFIKISANSFYIDTTTFNGFHPPELPKFYNIPTNAADLLETPAWIETYFGSVLYEFLTDLDRNYKGDWKPNDVEIILSYLELKIRIEKTMVFSLREERIARNTSGIIIRVNELISNRQNVYIPMYSTDIVVDEYPTPDDGFTFEIASDMSDSIKWIAQNKNLLVGTETGEWVIPAGVTATNVQAVLNSRYGSDKIQATSIGDAMCFFQTGKKALVEYYIPQQDNNFRANNMAMLSKNMLHESAAFDFDFISAPYTKIFVSREDGTIVTLLYERSTGTFAWGRVTTGKAAVENGVKTRTGLIKSVAAVPGLSGYDDVYLVVQRGSRFFLERHSDRVRSGTDEEEAVFLDSYRRWDGVRADYSGDVVVYDETDNKVYPVSQPPITGHVMWIGYPYESRVRSMPVLANDQMKQNNIKNLYIRFNDSFMPKARSVYMEAGKERTGNTDSIGRPEPYSGVVQVPFPGVWDHDVFFELIHDKPTRCRVLAVNAEAN